MTTLPRTLTALAGALLLGALFAPFSAPAQSGGAVYDSTYLDEMDYRMIGPYRGGRVTAVTGIADQPETYFMGSTGGGIWKTTNDG